MTLFFVLLAIAALCFCNALRLYGLSMILSTALAGAAVHWAIVSTSVWSVAIGVCAVSYAMCVFAVFIAAVAVEAYNRKAFKDLS